MSGFLLSRISNRWLYLAGALVIAGLFGGALYLQYVLYLDPCPLCMVQRLTFAAMLALFVIAAIHNPGPFWAKAYAGLISLFAILGVAVAGRHIWIQHLPKDQVPACGPGLDYMLDNFPLSKILKELLHGSGECAANEWHFLGLGIPQWALLWFVVLGAWAVLIVFKTRKS
jgi:disulfide bond formation protein DsbB